MVVASFGVKVRAIAGTFATAMTVLLANPANANSSAAADIAAPLRAAQAAKPATLGNGDENFRKLFNSWQSLEQTGVPALAAVADAATQANMTASTRTALVTRAVVPTSVSIPSRMPVDGVSLSSSYGMRTHPVLGGRRAHKGVDLAGPVGTPIRATADGVVGMAQWFSSYGLYIAVEHGGEIQTRYGHLSRLNVAAGQRVRKGDVIGFLGSTGRSTGPHLHYEVRVKGEAVNPVPYMQADHLVHVALNEKGGKGGPE